MITWSKIIIPGVVFLFTINTAFALDNVTILEQSGSQFQITNTSVVNFSNEYTPASSVKICGVGMALGNTSTTPDLLTWDIKLYQGGTTPQNGTLIDTIIPSINSYPTSTTHIQTIFDFTNCHILTSGIKYYFTYTNKGNTTPWTIGESLSSATTVFPWAQNSSNVWTRFTSFFWDFKLTGQSGEAIEITHPSDNSVISTDIGTFWADFNTNQTSSTVFYIDYATSTANLSNTSTLTSRSSWPLPGTAGQLYDVRIYVPLGVALKDGQNYKALARIYDGTTSRATSTIVSFTANSNLAPLPFDLPIGGSSIITSTSTTQTITCDPNSPFFQNSFCKLAVYLFIPDEKSFAQFQNVGDLLKNKPPFGYIAQVALQFTTLSTSTASSSIDLSALSGLSSIFNDFKSLISWIMWLLFGFWIYNKFRHFKF